MHLLSTREIPVRALVLLAQVTYANDFLALQVGSAYQFKRAVKPEHADTMSRLVDLRARVTPNQTRYIPESGVQLQRAARSQPHYLLFAHT